MHSRHLSAVAVVVLIGTLLTGHARVLQDADLAGRWVLNQELSENAEAQLRRGEAQGGHRPPAGLHGLGALFGGGRRSDTERAHGMFPDRPLSFVLTQDGDRIELTDSQGRRRVLTANGRQETIDGMSVRTRWEVRQLVSETSLGNGTITQTYERVATANQLIVTTRMNVTGQVASVRRVYDAERQP